MKGPHHPRLFLSYGVQDAAVFAEGLHRDLTARGFEIWQDIHRLRTGWPWSEEVELGLRGCQALLAVLSPHAVRRSGTAGNPTQTDSVCLDEIEYARFGCRIPIVPVKVLPCEAPFLIHRLQYIDFTRWVESKAAYQAGLDRICDAVQSAMRGESRERHWGRLPEPWDFGPFLREKRRGFTGRAWLFDEIDHWRTHGSDPALLITGGPGVGKSAIVAALVHDNPAGQVLAYHCCRADTPATLEPAGFVRSLAAMLAARLDTYAPILDDPAIARALDEAETDPASAFEAAVLAPLHKFPEPQGGRRYLLIDALDEALTRSRRPTILDVLATRLRCLPPWLGLVATTRNDPGVLSQVRDLNAHELSPENDRNTDDVRQFIHSRLAEPSLRQEAHASGQSDAALTENLIRASAGNFLFISMALKAVDRGQLNLGQIERLPPGLDSCYQIFFDRMFAAAGVDFTPSRQVLESLVAARESLSREQIAAATGLDDEVVLPALLARLAPFVPVREGRYALFHKSLFDWLVGRDPQSDLQIAGPYAVSVKRGHNRLADWCWAEHGRGADKASLYCLRHLATHLQETGRGGDLRQVLLDFRWLQAKLDATGVAALVTDCERPVSDAAVHLVQSAVRLSAHVLADDKTQLASQLLGRIPAESNPGVTGLLSTARAWRGTPWLCPLIQSLHPANSALLRTLKRPASVAPPQSDIGPFRVYETSVNGVALASDGRRVVSAMSDHTLKVWDIDQGHVLLTLAGHAWGVNCVALTPDGRRAVSGSDDATVRVWDLETGRELCPSLQHSREVNAIALTPDGRRAIAASSDQTLRLWELETGRELAILRGHTKPATALVTTSDGRHAVSGSRDQSLRLWDLETAREVGTFRGESGEILALALTLDGRFVAAGSSDNTVTMWDFVSREKLATFSGHAGDVNALAMHPAGRQVVSASEDRTIKVWDLHSGREIRTLHGHSATVVAVAVSRDGKRLVSGARDDTVKVWDLEADPSAGASPTHRDSVQAVAVSSDGVSAVSFSCDNTCRVWSLKDNRSVRALDMPRGWRIEAVAIGPEGVRGLAKGEGHILVVLDLEKGEALFELEGHKDFVGAMEFARDGQRIMTGSHDHTAIVWDLATGKETVLEGQTDKVYSVGLADSAPYAVSQSYDGTIKVWDCGTGRELHTLKEGGSTPGPIAISADGRRVVAFTGDHTLEIWNVASGSVSRELKLEGWTRLVEKIALSPDGGLVALGSEYDHNLEIWDVDGPKLMAKFTADSSILACAFMPDNRGIIAGEGAGRVHFLRLVLPDDPAALSD